MCGLTQCSRCHFDGRNFSKSFRKSNLVTRVLLACLTCLVMLPAGCLHRTPVDPDSRLRAASPSPQGAYFERVLIIVLENQKYEDVIQNPFFSQLAHSGASFTNFHALFHPSYPNYLAMIGGRSFSVHQLNPDRQIDFPDDAEHRTIADLLGNDGWKNYAENYPGGPRPCEVKQSGRYARKHVPFASFKRIQNNGQSVSRIVAVDPATTGTDNAFVRDVVSHSLPRYSFYSPNLDNDGHDPRSDPRTGLSKSSRWLEDLLTTKIPQGEGRHGLLIVVTFDESLQSDKRNRIYTVFLGDMIKPGEYQASYNHYNVLRTIEDNFQLHPYLGDGDAQARPIEGIWK